MKIVSNLKRAMFKSLFLVMSGRKNQISGNCFIIGQNSYCDWFLHADMMRKEAFKLGTSLGLEKFCSYIYSYFLNDSD